MSENGNFPFIGASGENNGVTGFTTKKDVENNSKLGYGTNEPDYEFMEECGRQMMAKKYIQYLKYLESTCESSDLLLK